MNDSFDPYYKWLSIPPSEQPPHHYRLLGTVLFEDDPDTIANAADRQMAHLRTFQTGPHSADSQRLLNEVAAARVCLLGLGKKAVCDAELRRKLAPPQPAPAQRPAQQPLVPRPIAPQPFTPRPPAPQPFTPKPVVQYKATLPVATPVPWSPAVTAPAAPIETAPISVSVDDASRNQFHIRRIPYRRASAWPLAIIVALLGLAIGAYAISTRRGP